MTDELIIRQQVLTNLRAKTGLDIQLDANNIAIKQYVGQAQLATVLPARFENRVIDVCPAGLTATNPPIVLMAPEILEPARTELRRQKIGYLDNKGNAYLDAPPIFLMLEPQPAGKAKERPEKKVAANRPGINRAFNEAGLRLLFALMTEPGLEKLAYRELAQRTGLALGTAHNVMNALKELKFLRIRGKTRGLLEKRELLEKWVNNFPDQLRPRLHWGTYRTLHTGHDWWKTVDLAGTNACWGGEPGGELLTNFLQAERQTLYVFGETHTAALQRLRLIPDPRGTVEILHAFWPRREKEEAQVTAPPLVVYADLLATRDGRNRETAERIYDAYLLPLVE